jgi:hypothetical protein
MAKVNNVMPRMKISLPLRGILTALLLLLCASATATGQEAGDYPANWCRNGLFPDDAAEFRLAKVGGNWTARIHFFKDDDDCPNYTVKCEMKSYLITGDEVLVSRKHGQWICGWYQPKKGGETVGWLLADKLAVSDAPARPPLKNWLGVWKYERQSLTIRREGRSNSLKVKGYAIWEGTGENVHVGGIEAVAQPQGNELVLVEEECRVSLKLVGDYLVAKDNSGCGGVNVRLNGVYRKGR